MQNIFKNYERVQGVVLGLKVMDNMKNNRKVQFLGRLIILLKLNFCSGTLLSICLLGGAFYSCYQIALHLNCALLLPFCNFNLQFVEMITLLLLIHHVGTLHIKKSSKP